MDFSMQLELIFLSAFNSVFTMSRPSRASYRQYRQYELL